MEFKQFKEQMQAHIASMLASSQHLFVTNVDKDAMWITYLDSFPPGHNKVYRVRREHDCSHCRQFVRAFGNVVAISGRDLQVVTIWDFSSDDPVIAEVCQKMAAFVKGADIQDVFVTKQSTFGVDKNHEQLSDDSVQTWEHFHVKLPNEFVTRSTETEATITGRLRDAKNVFKRSLDEITIDAIESVLDLVSQNSLYRGEEWSAPLTSFLNLHKDYQTFPTGGRDLYCWATSVRTGGSITKIRNHSIGTLLTDLSKGEDLESAVRKYEAIVAPTNYKRPKAVFTKRMVEQAQERLKELGLLNSLGRRFAKIDDITVNNILFADRDSLKQMGGVFEELEREAAVNQKQFQRVEEVSIDDFVNQILPRVTGINVFLENRHIPNLMSVIAPQNQDAKSLFKWNNGFSWAYNGNITDSMKERVKSAGGNVEGVLRFSLQWNEDGRNQNDFDAHCIEPYGNHIYFANKKYKHCSSGMLDVDIILPNGNIAVENIAWTDLSKMPEGRYDLFVHNYSHNGGRSGFTAEVEFDGQIYSFAYSKELRQGENVPVAYVTYSRKTGFSIQELLPSSVSSRKAWGLDTNQFHPVAVCMFSPNYWDGQHRIGNRHYFFILKGCTNDTCPNGFYNEFLREDLMPYKRVFETLGGKMQVQPSEDQLSGLGFSSTQRNSLVCKLSGHVSRTIKIVF